MHIKLVDYKLEKLQSLMGFIEFNENQSGVNVSDDWNGSNAAFLPR